MRIQTNIIESFHFEGIPGAFFRGRGPVWPGRGNTAALSPGPSNEHPAACRRAPDCLHMAYQFANMTEGAKHERQAGASGPPIGRPLSR